MNETILLFLFRRWMDYENLGSGAGFRYRDNTGFQTSKVSFKIIHGHCTGQWSSLLSIFVQTNMTTCCRYAHCGDPL